MSLIGGTADVSRCSFLSNSASTRGFAIAVVGSATIGLSSFEDNALHCAAGFFLQDIHEVDGNIPAPCVSQRLKREDVHKRVNPIASRLLRMLSHFASEQ